MVGLGEGLGERGGEGGEGEVVAVVEGEAPLRSEGVVEGVGVAEEGRLLLLLLLPPLLLLEGEVVGVCVPLEDTTTTTAEPGDGDGDGDGEVEGVGVGEMVAVLEVVLVKDGVGVTEGVGGRHTRVRTLWLPKSPTNRAPLEAKVVMPAGSLKRELVPTPSRKEAAALVLLPARVVTKPRGVAIRMRLFPKSAITRFPLEGSMVRW